MKLWTIFRFEFSYLAGRISTLLFLAVLLGFTFLMDAITTPGDGVYPNNTFHITATVVVGGLFWLVMGASIAGEAAARDVQVRMHPLTYTTPVSKLNYLGGRFLAALAVNGLLILSLPLGILLSFYLPGLDPEGFLPFRPWAYLSVYCLIALPNAFIATALQFTFAALSRQVMTSYVASLVLAIFAQIIAVTIAKLFGNWDFVRLMDPVGVTGIIGNELQTWTPADKNTRLVTLEGMFLWNRLLWMSVAVGLLFLTYLRFRFSNPATNNLFGRFKQKSKVTAEMSAGTNFTRTTSISVPRVQQTFNFATYFHQTLTIAFVSFKKIASSPIGLTLVAAIAIVSAAFGNRIMTQFGIPLLPTTQQVLDYLATPVTNINTPSAIIPLLIMFFAGRLIWGERDARQSDIIDAAPVPEWVFFAGKFVGLGLIVIVWMALLMAGGIMMQLGLGYDKFEISLYLKVLFGLQLVDYLLFALLAIVVHAVVNQKTIGYAVILLVFIFIAFPSSFSIEHNLLIFGAGPTWMYTDMRGFGATIWPWLWFKLYWIAWALLLAVVARLLWTRGREQRLIYRLQSAKRRFTGSTTSIAIIASGLILTLGSFIFYNTNIVNEYLTGADISERKAEYERRYSTYRNTPQPQLTGTKLNVEIYPGQQEVKIRAAYTLVNKDTLQIDSIHVGSFSGVEPGEVSFNRAASSVLIDKKLSHYIYALEQPLRPGDSLQLNFVIHEKARGFSHNGTKALVAENGTYFTNYDLLPAIGYQLHREIKDGVTRKKYNLVPRPAIPSLYDVEARKKPGSPDQTTLDVIVGTSHDQVAVAPGALLRSWTKGERRYFHYKTDASIGGEYALLSGKYSVKESAWNDVAIRIYYHHDGAKSIDRMLGSAKASLAYFTEQFGTYPYKHFTLIERAGNTGGATADASMIYYGEQFALMNPDDGPNGYDLPYYILAHEVAHQWWGLARLTPAHVEGAGVLIEGLAVYSGMQVLEKNYGDRHVQQYVSFLHSFYEMPRSAATPSLLQANEQFLYYRKGGLAMYALAKYIGKEKVNGALRRFLEKRSSGELKLPTTLDLYKEIEAITPDSLNYLLQDLFKENTYWRLKTKQFVAAQAQAGRWEVTLRVQAQKIVVDNTGNEKEVPMNDWLEIGLYEEGKGQHEPMYLQMHRIRSGEQTIKLTLPKKPERGGIDPNNLMIDLRRDDNMMQLDGV
ncbi:MAG TPA: M1 family aminopeptidase [Chryseosolibacter sp.]|nr:M1 family aminopeptidase [Chryseosolibacter sp.]